MHDGLSGISLLSQLTLVGLYIFWSQMVQPFPDQSGFPPRRITVFLPLRLGSLPRPWKGCEVVVNPLNYQRVPISMIPFWKKLFLTLFPFTLFIKFSGLGFGQEGAKLFALPIMKKTHMPQYFPLDVGFGVQPPIYSTFACHVLRSFLDVRLVKLPFQQRPDIPAGCVPLPPQAIQLGFQVSW